MYKLVKNNEFDLLKKMVINADQDNTFINAIGHDHKMNEFKLADTGSVELTYSNQLSGATTTLLLKEVQANYDFDIEKTNREYPCYLTHMRHELKDWSITDIPMNITRKVSLIGISVGDLFKHFNFSNPNGFAEEKQTEEIVDPNCQVDRDVILFNKFLKKSLQVDTSSCDYRDVLGLYFIGNNSVNLWTDLKINSQINKAKGSFQEFCQKMLYFSVDSINSLSWFDQKTKIHYIREESFNAMFNQISSQNIVRKLLRYFFYNENPEFMSEVQCLKFDPPKSIPDVLKYVKEKYEDNRCLDLYNKIMKKLNNHEKQILEEKYQPSVFKSCAKIPGEYPFFSLRNIYVKEWNHKSSKGGFFMYSDVDNLIQRHQLYRNTVKCSKYKYLSTKNTKSVPLNLSVIYGNYDGQDHSKHRPYINTENLAREALCDTEYVDDDFSESDEEIDSASDSDEEIDLEEFGIQEKSVSEQFA